MPFNMNIGINENIKQNNNYIFVMSVQGSANSRFTIINWINDTLLLPLTKIEELGAGNVYCQLLDAGYPDRIPIHKVKWDAKLQVDFLHNFKILQNSFQYLGIQKKIDIQKLAKAKYQDNLEFVQWLKSYIQQKIDYSSYEPLKRRNYAKINLDFLNISKKKFNVTLTATTNKQNLDNSLYMKSSVRSNVTMKSIVGSRSSASILTPSHMIASTNSNNLIDKSKNELKGIQKRKSVGPMSYISNISNKKKIQKNQSVANILKETIKNVEEILSEQQQDQFF